MREARLLAGWLPAALGGDCPPALAARLLRDRNAPPAERIDWRAAFARAHAQGIAPLLWESIARWGLADALGDRAAPFAAAHGATLRQNILHLAELERITRRLASIGVRPILLKGAAFLTDLYPHPALRPMADLDLLVRPADVPRALDALLALGYEGLRPGVADALRETNHEIELARRLADGTRLYVEVHWRLLPRESLVAGPLEEPEGLWRRARRCRDPRIDARVLAPEDALLFSALHLQRHAYSRALWFVDMALLMRKHGLDWALVRREAEAFGARSALHVALEGTAALCGTGAPPQAARAVRPGAFRRAALSAILRWNDAFGPAASRGEHALPPARRYLLKVVQARDTLAALGRILKMIHPSEAWLRARYGVPRGARPAGLRRRHLRSVLRAALGSAGGRGLRGARGGLEGSAPAG